MGMASTAMNAPFAEESQWVDERKQRILPASAPGTLDPLGRKRESVRTQTQTPKPATATFNDDGVYETPTWMQWLVDKAESSEAPVTAPVTVRSRGSTEFDFDRDDADFVDAVSE